MKANTTPIDILIYEPFTNCRYPFLKNKSIRILMIHRSSTLTRCFSVLMTHEMHFYRSDTCHVEICLMFYVAHQSSIVKQLQTFLCFAKSIKSQTFDMLTIVAKKKSI